MSKHTLSIDEIDEQFELIAIHSSSHLHSLAFNINRALDLRLSRSKQDVSFGDKNEKYKSIRAAKRAFWLFLLL